MTQWRNSEARFGAAAIALHWLTLLVMAAVYASMELHEVFPRNSGPRNLMQTWHYMLGLAILGLVALRLLLQLGSPTPRADPTLPRWQQLAARAVHLALYALLLAMPLLGSLILSAEGKPIPFFGLGLPPLIGADAPSARLIEEIHEIGASLGYVLVGLHATAALFHHYILRDDALRRMLPQRA